MIKIIFVLVVSFSGFFKIYAQRESIEFQNDSTKRYFRITLPSTYQKNIPIPMVIVLHDYSTNVDQTGLYTQMDQMAEDAGFITVYPEATINEQGYYIWNAGNKYEEWTKNAKDVEFIQSLIGYLVDNYNINESKIFVAGYSNGAMMAYKLALELSDKIAGVACVSGPMVEESVVPKNPVPIMHIHGDADMIVPHTGTKQYGFQMVAVDEVIKKWLDWNDCSHVPAVLKYNRDVTALLWKGVADVRLYLLHDVGHDWPTKKRCNWSAAEYIWEFFNGI
jgi:polyhydroxybutyrate depolymerase